MKRALVGLAVLILAGCGVDGEPITPSTNATVSVGSSGTHVGVGTTLSKGNTSITLGTGF